MKPGDRLKQARTNRGLTQAELAARLRLKRPAISNWERTKNFPKSERLTEVAKTLGVTTEWILTGKIERDEGQAVTKPEEPLVGGLQVSTVEVTLQPAGRIGLLLLHEGQVVVKIVLTREQARDLRSALEGI